MVKLMATSIVREMGYIPQLSLLFVAVFIVFSVLIYARGLGLHFRLSLLPLSLVPIALGIFGASKGAVEGISLFESTKPDEVTALALYHLYDVAQILPQMAVESVILLLITSLLLMTTPKAEQGAASNRSTASSLNPKPCVRDSEGSNILQK